MKNILYFLTCVFLLTLTGCNKFLDILPDDKPVLEDAFKDQYNAEKYLFTCYRFLPTFANPHNSLGLSGGGDIIYSERNTGGGLSAGPPAPMMIFLKGNNVSNP